MVIRDPRLSRADGGAAALRPFSRIPRCTSRWTRRIAASGAPHRIHAHVALTVLALLLERLAEQACGDSWRNIRDDLRRIKLAQLSSPNGAVWPVTEPAPDDLKRLQSLQIQNPPPPILRLA